MPGAVWQSRGAASDNDADMDPGPRDAAFAAKHPPGLISFPWDQAQHILRQHNSVLRKR
jgi:hypothetical protein